MCIRDRSWCWGQIVHLNFLIDKLHKAVSVLFRCTKIRKSKPAWVRFSQSDVNGNNESSMTRCCLVLPSVAEHHCVLPGSLRFTNFLPKSQKQSRLCAICQSLCCESLFAPTSYLRQMLHVTQGNLLWCTAKTHPAARCLPQGGFFVFTAQFCNDPF